jgi:uncharacterized protein Veg
MGKGVLNKGADNHTILEEVKRLFDRTDVSQVRNDIRQIIGSTVKLETNKGRHKAEINRGIVSNVYPSIFTVQLSGGANRNLSFSYTDVLTNTVEITLCEESA